MNDYLFNFIVNNSSLFTYGTVANMTRAYNLSVENSNACKYDLHNVFKEKNIKKRTKQLIKYDTFYRSKHRLKEEPCSYLEVLCFYYIEKHRAEGV